MSKARELASLGNAYSDGALSNRNVLINGSFTVSQRGDYTTATSISSGSYSIDRWKANDPFDLQHFTGQVIDGTRTNYIRVSYNGTQSMGIMQPVEDKNYDQLRGKTITISAYVRTNQAAFGFRIYDGSQNYGPRFNADGNWHRATWTFDWTATSPTNLLVLFDTYNNGSYPTIGSGDYMDIAMVQVEVGDTATPFEHRSYGQELALCQRYYQKQPIPQYVYPTDAGQLTWVVPLSVPLRTTPTITAKSAFYAHRKDASGIVTLWDGAGSYSASVYEYEAGEISIRNNFDGGVVAGIYTINASPTLNNTNSGLAKLYFDAEL